MVLFQDPDGFPKPQKPSTPQPETLKPQSEQGLRVAGHRFNDELRSSGEPCERGFRGWALGGLKFN